MAGINYASLNELYRNRRQQVIAFGGRGLRSLITLPSRASRYVLDADRITDACTGEFFTVTRAGYVEYHTPPNTFHPNYNLRDCGAKAWLESRPLFADHILSQIAPDKIIVAPNNNYIICFSLLFEGKNIEQDASSILINKLCK